MITLTLETKLVWQAEASSVKSTMLTVTERIDCVFIFRLWLIFGLVFGLTGVNRGESKTDYTQYNYGDVTEDVSDIRFYRGPETNEVYKQKGFSRKAKNVIFLIGDGMGPVQVQIARRKAVGAAGKLYMEKFPVTGFAKTQSANSPVTDSAAGGTALACGIKTNNGMLGMDPDQKPYRNLLEAAQEMGKKTGLVATSTISHATPAAFGSHINDRGKEQEIAAQILEHDIQVLLGGGRSHWLAENRQDKRDLLAEAKEKGYRIVTDLQQMEEAEGPYVLGLFQDSSLTTFSPEPSIGQMTRKAIQLLSRNKKNGTVCPFFGGEKNRGFFLMVEGSQIDWACHANNPENSVKQTLLFDLAVREAAVFALHDKHTLVVVTADHETGGLANLGEEVKWGGGGHSAADVPVYAFGPGSELFTGVMDNTEVARKIARAMGIREFPAVRE